MRVSYFVENATNGGYCFNKKAELIRLVTSLGVGALRATGTPPVSVANRRVGLLKIFQWIWTRRLDKSILALTLIVFPRELDVLRTLDLSDVFKDLQVWSFPGLVFLGSIGFGFLRIVWFSSFPGKEEVDRYWIFWVLVFQGSG